MSNKDKTPKYILHASRCLFEEWCMHEVHVDDILEETTSIQSYTLSQIMRNALKMFYKYLTTANNHILESHGITFTIDELDQQYTIHKTQTTDEIDDIPLAFTYYLTKIKNQIEFMK